MLKRPVTSEELERLREERDEASRRYNDALTALDRALPRAEPAAIEAGPFDDRQVSPLNERWKILPEQALPAPRGLRSRRRAARLRRSDFRIPRRGGRGAADYRRPP